MPHHPTYVEAIASEIQGMVDDYDFPHGAPLDYGLLAAQLTKELDERGAGHLDPQDEPYWREVASELSRRGITAQQ